MVSARTATAAMSASWINGRANCGSGARTAPLARSSSAQPSVLLAKPVGRSAVRSRPDASISRSSSVWNAVIGSPGASFPSPTPADDR